MKNDKYRSPHGGEGGFTGEEAFNMEYGLFLSWVKKFLQ